MAGKYQPLEKYLRNLPASRQEIALSFKQIENILKDKLPASAYEDERWWRHATEGNHINRRAWDTAGWKIEKLDVSRHRVKLVRVK